jgi:hypothetical protein
MRSILFTGLLLLPLLSYAQESEGEGLLLQQLNQSKEVLTVPELKTAVKDRIDFGLEAGTAFTTFGRYGSMVTSYLAPEIRYQATPRVHFSAGVILSTGFMPARGNAPTELTNGYAGVPMFATGNRFNRILVFAEGSYRVNQRLTIGGMLVKELDNDLYRNMNAFQKNSGFQSIGMNVNYKITDNFHVGARFNVTDGRPYYYSDPTNPFMQRSPFSPGW